MDIISKDIIYDKNRLLEFIKKYKEHELLSIRTSDNKFKIRFKLLDLLNEESIIFKTISNFSEEYFIIEIKCLEYEICDRNNEISNYYLNLLINKTKCKIKSKNI